MGRIRAVLDRLEGSSEGRHLALAGWLIGVGLGLSVGLMVAVSDALLPLCAYGVVLGVFHTMEFALTALYHPLDLNFDSSLLNHSSEYLMAHIGAVIEFLIGVLLAPYLPWKRSDIRPILTAIGLIIVVIGQSFRTLAMIEAGRNFTHVIATIKEEQHDLITTGVYRLIRHPSYLGFFLWACGAQVLLGNPICTLIFIVSLWKYFAQRVRYEEVLLIRFFGEAYLRYRSRVRHTGIPFVGVDFNYD